MTEIDGDCRIRDAVRGSKIRLDIQSKLHKKIDSFPDQFLHGARRLQSYNTNRVERDFPRCSRFVGCEDQRDSFQRGQEECCMSDFITSRIRMKIRFFNGTSSTLVDWVVVVEDFFVQMEIPEELKCKIAAYAMEGEAERRWQQLQCDRIKVGKSKIYSWEKMKHSMLKVFLPNTCLIKVPSVNTVYDNEIVNEQQVGAVIQGTSNILAAEDSEEENNDDDLEEIVVADHSKETVKLESAACSIKCPLEADLNNNDEKKELSSLGVLEVGIETLEKTTSHLLMPIDGPTPTMGLSVITCVGFSKVGCKHFDPGGIRQDRVLWFQLANFSRGLVEIVMQEGSDPDSMGIEHIAVDISQEQHHIEDKGVTAELKIGAEHEDTSTSRAMNIGPQVMSVKLQDPKTSMLRSLADSLIEIYGFITSRFGNEVVSKVHWVEKGLNRTQTLWSSNDVDILVDELIMISFDPLRQNGISNFPTLYTTKKIMCSLIFRLIMGKLALNLVFESIFWPCFVIPICRFIPLCVDTYLTPYMKVYIYGVQLLAVSGNSEILASNFIRSRNGDFMSMFDSVLEFMSVLFDPGGKATVVLVYEGHQKKLNMLSCFHFADQVKHASSHITSRNELQACTAYSRKVACLLRCAESYVNKELANKIMFTHSNPSLHIPSPMSEREPMANINLRLGENLCGKLEVPTGDIPKLFAQRMKEMFYVIESVDGKTYDCCVTARLVNLNFLLESVCATINLDALQDLKGYGCCSEKTRGSQVNQHSPLNLYGRFPVYAEKFIEFYDAVGFKPTLRRMVTFCIDEETLSKIRMLGPRDYIGMYMEPIVKDMNMEEQSPCIDELSSWMLLLPTYLYLKGVKALICEQTNIDHNLTRGRAIPWEGWKEENKINMFLTAKLNVDSVSTCLIIVCKIGQIQEPLELFYKVVNGLDPPIDLDCACIALMWISIRSLVDELLKRRDGDDVARPVNK